MTDVPLDSNWMTFGLGGADTGNYIDQFTNFVGMGTFQDTEEFIKEIFNKFDRDSSGSIDASEISNVLEQCGHHTSKENVDKMLKEMDQDNNG